MEKFENEFIKIWIEHYIVHVVFLSEHYTAPMVDDAIKARLQLTKDKNYKMLSDIRKLKSFSYDAKRRIAMEDSYSGIKACAILVNSNVQKVIFDFFNAKYNVPVPSMTFSDAELALKWFSNLN